jgi:hypothetical protein
MSRRRPLRVAILAGVAMACLVGSGIASAGSGGWSNWAKVPSAMDLDPTACGFPIHIVAVVNQQYQREMTLADGTVIQQVKGLFAMTFTNTDTSKTIFDYELGPLTSTNNPDGSGFLDAQGHHPFYFLPVDQANVGEPGLIFWTGRVHETWDTSGTVTTFTLSGRQTNACNLLK